jgi:hypothetical protein
MAICAGFQEGRGPLWGPLSLPASLESLGFIWGVGHMVAWAAQDLCSFAASIALFLRPLGASMCTTAAFCIPSIIWLQVKLFALGLVY